jgi:hypothetical protein
MRDEPSPDKRSWRSLPNCSRSASPRPLCSSATPSARSTCCASPLRIPTQSPGLCSLNRVTQIRTRDLVKPRDPALFIAGAATHVPSALRSGLGSIIATAGAVLPLDRRLRAMTKLAPLVAARLRAVREEHAETPNFFSYAGDLIRSGTVGDLPMEVLTGADNFVNDHRARTEWQAMHAELAALSSRGSHRQVDAGHDVPFSAPDAVVDAISRVASTVGT